MNRCAPIRMRWAQVVSLFLMLSGGTAARAAAVDARVPDSLAGMTQRCIQLAELVSCDAALSMKPNDPGLLLAEADVLVQLKRPGEAIGVYRNAARAGAPEEVVKQKIGAARELRQAMVNTCLTQSGSVGVHACEAAWLPGAPDEVALFKRRGSLLQDENPMRALDAYLSAARLAPHDREVARAVIASSGGLEVKGADILLARGAAFLALRAPRDALLPLRQALKLSPDSIQARNLLRQAEAEAREFSPAAGVPRGTVSATPEPVSQANVSDGPKRAYSNDAPMTRTY